MKNKKKIKLLAVLLIFLAAWYFLGFVLPPLVVITPLNKDNTEPAEYLATSIPGKEQENMVYIGSDEKYDYYYNSDTVEISAVNINGRKCSIKEAFQSGRISAEQLTALGFVETFER